MKKLVFVIICLFVVSITVSAQQGNQGNRPTPEESAKRSTQMMKDSLNLTKEQVAPIDSINLVFAKAQAKLFEKAEGDFASISEDLTKLNALRLEAYEKFLTDEQMQAYKKMMERIRNRGPRRN